LFHGIHDHRDKSEEVVVSKKTEEERSRVSIVSFIALTVLDILLVIFFAASAAVMLPFAILTPLELNILPWAFVSSISGNQPI
jgi:hypothetical protein